MKEHYFQRLQLLMSTGKYNFWVKCLLICHGLAYPNKICLNTSEFTETNSK